MGDEKKQSLFRKSSLERVSSPEQLNEYIKIINPSLVAILVAIFLILFGCSFWIFSGSIPKYLDLKGIAVTSKSGVQNVYCYVPISVAKRLNVGMDVQISPDYAPREQYGYINGEVIDIGENIVTNEYLVEKFENPRIVLPVISGSTENLVQVQLNLKGWSSEKGEKIKITDGSTCTASVVESEQKPYQLIFNA